MRCLDCKEEFNEVHLLNAEKPEIDLENYFFKKLLICQRVFIPSEYFRCDHFCVDGRDEKTTILITSAGCCTAY